MSHEEADGGDGVGTVVNHGDEDPDVHGTHDEGVEHRQELGQPDLVVGLEEQAGADVGHHQGGVEDESVGVVETEGNIEGSDQHLNTGDREVSSSSSLLPGI